MRAANAVYDARAMRIAAPGAPLREQQVHLGAAGSA